MNKFEETWETIVNTNKTSNYVQYLDDTLIILDRKQTTGPVLHRNEQL